MISICKGLDKERVKMTGKKQVNLWLPEEDVAALDKMAAAQSRSRSNLVKLIIAEFVRQHEVVETEAGGGTANAGLCTGDHI